MWLDTTVADFSAGSGTNTYVSQTADGQVMLAPTVGAEFSGSGLPSGWSSTLWAGGSGGSVIAGGTLTLDQALLATTSFLAPGRSLEFVANFSAQNQHAGFANDFNNGQWAIFSTGATGDQLYARSLVGSQTNTGLGASYLNAFHRYRIDWSATSATYFIDGVQVASHALPFTDSLRPATSDSNLSGSLAIDWMRMSPYTSPGTFTSRVFDAGGSATWGTLDSTSNAAHRHLAGAERADPGHVDPRRQLDSLHPGCQRRRHPRRLALRAVLGLSLTSSDANATPQLQSVSIGYSLAPAAFTLSGTVNTGSGALAGAAVHAFDATTNAYFGTSVTTAAGAYSFSLPSGASRWRAWARLWGRLPFGLVGLSVLGLTHPGFDGAGVDLAPPPPRAWPR